MLNRHTIVVSINTIVIAVGTPTFVPHAKEIHVAATLETHRARFNDFSDILEDGGRLMRCVWMNIESSQDALILRD